MGSAKDDLSFSHLGFYFVVQKMLEFGLVWQGVVLAAATERGLLDREELAGEFLAPLSSPQGRQGPCQKRGLSHENKNTFLF
jgi:hypothetical protein